MSAKLFYTTSLSQNSMSIVSLILRLVAGGAMLSHGIPKLMAFSELSQSFPDPLGIGSLISLLMALGAEVGCSLLLILGLFTRLALFPLFFTMMMAFFIIHGNDPFAVKELALMYMTIYVAIFAIGAGRYSIDKLIFKK